MYQVSLYNNGIETIIHYPNADKEAPHIAQLPLKEGLSQVGSLSFILYSNSNGYNNLFELTTKVKVIDTRDNTIRYTGRVLDINEKMGSDGLFYKEITCEGALSYLNDSKQRANAFITINPTLFLSEILAIHNSKVDDSKNIIVGDVDVIGSVAYSCSYETTLASILAVREKIGGDIKVRETNGILYMDWLQSFSTTTINVGLGENMKDMIKSKDVTTLGTRIIPLGANNLTITSINGGIDYIEDATAKIKYGIIEKTVEYKDIIDPTELYNTCLADLSNYTQPLLLLESNALDLSYLTGEKTEQFELGVDLRLFNPIMSIDSIAKIVQIDLDLLQPYDPKLTIANFPVKLSSSINDLRKSSIQKESVSNGVQIGDSFGIRIVRSDNNVITTLNATEGINIENDTKKVFYVDVNGKLFAIDITANGMTANEGTFNNMTANEGTFNNINAINGTFEGEQKTVLNGVKLIQNYKNANGGLMQIYDNNGNLNVKVGSENGTGTNRGGTIILYDDNLALPRLELGISTLYGAGTINLKDSSGIVRVMAYAGSGNGPAIAVLNSSQSPVTYLTETSGAINNQTIATQSWVASYVAAHAYTPPPPA